MAGPNEKKGNKAMTYKKITKEELEVFLRKHKLWLENKEGGERADLSRADLSRVNLSGANLSWANLRGANLRGANLSWADLRGADLSRADLSRVNLSWANLSWADLRGVNLSRVNLDYSVLPLWCGSLTANFDDRQLIQIAYHLVKAGLQSNNASEETKAELAKLVDFANEFHRVIECGVIKHYEKETDNEQGKAD